jgi:hypothetical protein
MKQKSQIFLIAAGLTFLIVAFILGDYVPPTSTGNLYTFHILFYIWGAMFMGMAVGYSVGIKESANSQTN